jgi:hypothetical protein
MAFVNHLKDKQFLKSKMKKESTQGQGVRFLLDEKMYSLQPFWDRVIAEASNTRHHHGRFATLTL